MKNAKILFGVLLLLPCLQITAAEDVSSATAVGDLDARILEILEETGAPGMIGAIVYGDEMIWQGALGVANIEFERPVTPDTLFRVGSITKTMVSLSILKLVERGQIELDGLITDLAPEAGVENFWKDTSPIKLVHTLEHTAGFDDIHFKDYAFSDPNVTTLQGIESNNNSRRSRWRPGTRMAYSNIGPAVAALALENVTGMRFESFVSEEIFKPLGMNTATLFFAEGVAASYTPDNTKSPYIHIPVRPSGSMNATSADMAQLLKMFIGRGSLSGVQLIQPESLSRMETPTTTVAAGNGLQTGYGLSNYTTLRNGFVFHGHNGGIDGFSSSYAYLPSAERGFFYSVNQPNSLAVRRINELIADFITEDLTPPVPTAIIEQTESELAQFEGVYERNSPRMELIAGVERLLFSTVRVIDGKLLIKPFLGDEIELFPVGNSMFRGADEAIASFAFVSSPDNEDLLQTGQSTLMKISSSKAYGRILSIGYAVLVLLSTIVFTGIWIGRKLLRRSKEIPYLRVRSVPAIATLFFSLYVYVIASMLSSSGIGEVTILTVGFWLISLLLPIVVGMSVYVVISNFGRRQQVGIAVWHHSLHTVIALSILVTILISYGFIGMRTWAY
ncbi:MAG: CubicO group peptidase (beta-lactamase class C family) [Candidatus Azotimanducaceae bacterium]|jgi:CubicO group peptidase (beta-lactamase class C family)